MQRTRSTRNARLAWAWLAVGGLSASACGSGSGGETPFASNESFDAPEADTAGANAELPTIFDVDAEGFARVTSLADTLVATLGSDDAASEALIRALDDGYVYEQVVAAIEVGALRADGTIDGVDPAGTPSNRVALRRIRRRRVARAEEEVDLLPVGVIRVKADELAGEEEFPAGMLTTATILMWYSEGLSPSEILEGLILGQVDFERDGQCLRKVIGEQVAPCPAESVPIADESPVDNDPGSNDEDVDAATAEPGPAGAFEVVEGTFGTTFSSLLAQSGSFESDSGDAPPVVDDATFTIGATMTGEMNLAGDIFILDSDPTCVSLTYRLDPTPLATDAGEQRYDGTGLGAFGEADQSCSDGLPAPDTTAAIEFGSFLREGALVVTLVSLVDGETLTFTVPRLDE